MSVLNNISTSSQTFRDVVFPATMQRSAPSLAIVSLESMADSWLATLLDTSAGIDSLIGYHDQVFTLATRVQWTGVYDTFTVRSKLPSGNRTELDKRRTSIYSNSLYPVYTMQAYVTPDKRHLIQAALVDTRHLINMCDAYPYQRRTNPDGTVFNYVNWDQCDPELIIVWRNNSEAAQ